MLTQRLKTLFYETRYKTFKIFDQAHRPDMEEEFKEIHKKCKKYTITLYKKCILCILQPSML